MSTTTTLSTTTPTSSYSDLFPTSSSTTDDSNRDGSHTGPNVYYLVFLGVLVALMIVAACLALRALRMRRRYRTATQIALARGEPLPPHMRDDYWGLGGLSGWTAEGLDRLGAIRPGEEGRRDRWKQKWAKVPALHEAEVEKEEAGHDANEHLWQHVTPLTVHSRRPLEGAETFAALGDGTLESTDLRNMGPRPRPAPLFHFARHRSPSPSTSHAAAARNDEQKTHELYRTVHSGEALTMAVVIQMPSDVARPQYNDPDEVVAWEPGMELGVWEGVVGQTVASDPQRRPLDRTSYDTT